jgi:hypothetical protein
MTAESTIDTAVNLAEDASLCRTGIGVGVPRPD